MLHPLFLSWHKFLRCQCEVSVKCCGLNTTGIKYHTSPRSLVFPLVFIADSFRGWSEQIFSWIGCDLFFLTFVVLHNGSNVFAYNTNDSNTNDFTPVHIKLTTQLEIFTLRFLHFSHLEFNRLYSFTIFLKHFFHFIMTHVELTLLMLFSIKK